MAAGFVLLLVRRMQQSVVVQLDGLITFTGGLLQRRNVQQSYETARVADHSRFLQSTCDDGDASSAGHPTFEPCILGSAAGRCCRAGRPPAITTAPVCFRERARHYTPPIAADAGTIFVWAAFNGRSAQDLKALITRKGECIRFLLKC